METANSVVRISTHKSSKPQQPQAAARTSEAVIREWIARFAINCGQPLSEARVLLWIDELSDIEPESLEHAFRGVMRSHTFNTIPQVGEIRALIDQANAKAFELKAEEAWQFAENFCMRHYHPDMGVSRRAPELPAAVNHAIRAAGGMNFIYNCSREELVWAKKRFIEDYTTIHETGQVEHLLTDGEARRILRQIASGGPQSDRRLTDGKAEKKASATTAVKPQPTDAEVNQATEAARRKIFGGPIREKSESELAEEVRRQKAALIARGWLPAEQPGQNPARLSPVPKSCESSAGSSDA